MTSTVGADSTPTGTPVRDRAAGEAGPADHPGQPEWPLTLRGEVQRLLHQDPPLHRGLLTGGAVIVVAGVVLRFVCPSALWLDETISVNISKLSLTQIPVALSHDGAPPLYYYLLHFWMLAFGRGDFAVRALSGVISVGTLPFFWMAGKRLGGRTTAWVTFFLGVAPPFAIEYATATRMYSLMILWSLLGFLALNRALEQPTRRRLVALGAVTAAILYTHYWGLYLVAVSGFYLFARIRLENRRLAGAPPRWPRARARGRRWASKAGIEVPTIRRAGPPSHPNPPGLRASFRAMVFGSLFFLPWSPVFVFQTLHTGTPWTGAAGPADILDVFGDFAGTGPWALLLSFIFFTTIVLGIFGHPLRAAVPSRRTHAGTPAASWVVLGLRPRQRIVPLGLVVAGTVTLAVVAGAIAQAAFVARYAAVILPLFLLIVAVGITVFHDRRIVVGILLVASVAGVLTGLGENLQPRTQAVQVAAVLNVQARPGDLVVYCPDQLGPAVDRLLTVPDVTELTFPRAIGPQRVDWVDYKETIERADVGAFAQEMLRRVSAGHTLWLVWRDGYPGLGGDCGYLKSWLNFLRAPGETVVVQEGKYYEYENLVRYPS